MFYTKYMPFNDGIDRKYSFSLTDFHDFDYCPFRFFLFHHLGLGKKYELAEGSYNMALGCLLDETIKLFHKQSFSTSKQSFFTSKTKSYGQPPLYIESLIKASCKKILDKIAYQNSPSFYSCLKPFLDDGLCKQATDVFINYYLRLDKKIKKSITEVGFCEWIVKDDPSTDSTSSLQAGSGQAFKLWGGPDTIEMGDGGIPEICDYKYRENKENGKESFDMDLMPKLYTLLCCKKLLDLGFKKVRFIIRLWLEPKNNSYYEEFDLEKVAQIEEIFKQKILRILNTREIIFCEKPFCKACNSDKRSIYLTLCKNKNLCFNAEGKII